MKEKKVMNKVVISGTSHGIGRAIAIKFLQNGWNVVGFDIDKSTIFTFPEQYEHFVMDLSKPVTKEEWPDLGEINVLINNAGTQSAFDRPGYDIELNLKGAMRFTEAYEGSTLDSILFIGSVSAHSGFEFPEYVASKAGLVGYMKNVAMRVAKRGVTCNSLDPGGVLTELNLPVTENAYFWNEIMKVTPLRRWATPEEIAEWSYFLTAVQSFCTGQSIVVDGGEKDLNSHFVWPDFNN